jgi:AAA domain
MEIRQARDTLRDLAKRPLPQERATKPEAIRRRDEDHESRFWKNATGRPKIPEHHPTYAEVAKDYSKKELQISDPTTLLVVDEADRLRMASLEQVRAIFDAGEIGVILTGMPGLEND